MHIIISFNNPCSDEENVKSVAIEIILGAKVKVHIKITP